MSDRIRWGILGPGNIARAFTTALKSLPDATLQAVGSQTPGKAEKFKEEFGFQTAHAGYEALAADPDVDIIYIATPHTGHAPAMRLCLEAGKPVLCEKPFTVNRAEAESVVRLAREKGLLLVEGMWTRFFPTMSRLRELIQEGAIGKPRLVQADFGFQAGFNPSSRLFDPNLAGGALLDVGVYAVSFASMVLGTPSAISGLATKGETGVDELAAFVLQYPDGALASLYTAVRVSTPIDALVLGEEGSLRVRRPFFRPQGLTLSKPGQPDEEFEFPIEGNGFEYEAMEAMRLLRLGKTESEILPLDESLAIMGTMDALREQWGVRYPFEA